MFAIWIINLNNKYEWNWSYSFLFHLFFWLNNQVHPHTRISDAETLQQPLLVLNGACLQGVAMAFRGVCRETGAPRWLRDRRFTVHSIRMLNDLPISSVSCSLVTTDFAKLPQTHVSFIFAAFPVTILNMDYSLPPAAQEIPHALLILSKYLILSSFYSIGKLSFCMHSALLNQDA